MSGCQPAEPDEQAWIARAEADARLDARHRLLRLTPRIKYDAQHSVRRGKARIDPDRLLKLGRRAIGARSPHADQGQSKVGVRIASIEGDRALRQLE